MGDQYSAVVDYDPGAADYNITNSDEANFIAMYDMNCNFLCAFAIKPGHNETYDDRHLAVSGSNVYVTADFDIGGADFDPDVPVYGLPNSGEWDIYIAKYDMSCCASLPVTVNVAAQNILCNNQCTGTATATPTSNCTSPFIYSWNTTPVQTTQTATGLCAGTYIVTIIDAANDTIKDTVVVTEPPPIVLSANANPANINFGDSTQLNATGGGTCQWSPVTGLNNPNIFNPFATPDTTTTYYVTVTDSNGCTNTDSVTVFVNPKIEIKCGNIYVPNAFSPNGDGQNDILYVRGNCIKEMTFTIYDRWGEKVFETTDITKGWDGKHKGKEMNAAIFVYYFSATLVNNNQTTQKGNISLLK